MKKVLSIILIGGGVGSSGSSRSSRSSLSEVGPEEEVLEVGGGKNPEFNKCQDLEGCGGLEEGLLAGDQKGGDLSFLYVARLSMAKVLEELILKFSGSIKGDWGEPSSISARSRRHHEESDRVVGCCFGGACLAVVVLLVVLMVLNKREFG